jgi:RNA 2',3'-cyclic 3'-phosphodiesterase
LTQTRDTSSGTVEGSDRLRLFCALRLPDETIEELVAWQARELHAGRVVARGNLHVTLAFLGWRPAAELEPVASALGEAARGAERPVFTPVRYRETRSVGMLVLDDLESRAGAFATDLFERLERLGVYEREARPWLPHLTVLRFKDRPRLRPKPPELGSFSPSDAAVYLSRLRPGGAQYEVMESVPLGG